MFNNKAAEFASNYKRLANILSKYEKITRYDQGDEKEAWTLSHAFLDLNESFKKFSCELLPKLFNENLSEEEIVDILHTIGEEFRHILYHIKENKYYDHLK